jgi:hypothetical protein
VVDVLHAMLASSTAADGNSGANPPWYNTFGIGATPLAAALQLLATGARCGGESAVAAAVGGQLLHALAQALGGADGAAGGGSAVDATCVVLALQVVLLRLGC